MLSMPPITAAPLWKIRLLLSSGGWVSAGVRPLVQVLGEAGAGESGLGHVDPQPVNTWPQGFSFGAEFLPRA